MVASQANGWMIGIVCWFDIATHEQRDAEGAEVTGRHAVRHGNRTLRQWRRRRIGPRIRSVRNSAAQRNQVRDRSRFDPRHALQFGAQSLDESRL